MLIQAPLQALLTCSLQGYSVCLLNICATHWLETTENEPKRFQFERVSIAKTCEYILVVSGLWYFTDLIHEAHTKCPLSSCYMA